MNTITPLSSIPALNTSTEQSGGQQQGRGHSFVGEIFKVTVLQSRPDNHYLLDLAGSKIVVKSNSHYTPGQNLNLQVTQTTPQVEFKVVSEGIDLISGKSLGLLGKNLDLSPLLNTLQQSGAFQASSLSAASVKTFLSFLPLEFLAQLDSNEGGKLLSELFNRLGITFEQQLLQGKSDDARRTLKAALLEVTSTLKGSQNIQEQAHKSLATLELYQAAQLQLTNQNMTIFPLPLPFLEYGYLLLDNSSADNHNASTPQDKHSVSLHLSMKSLGDMEITFLQNDQSLFIKFLFDSDEKSKFFEQFSQQLIDKLSTGSHVSLLFGNGAENPATKLARYLLPDGQSLINTTV